MLVGNIHSPPHFSKEFEASRVRPISTLLSPLVSLLPRMTLLGHTPTHSLLSTLILSRARVIAITKYILMLCDNDET